MRNRLLLINLGLLFLTACVSRTMEHDSPEVSVQEQHAAIVEVPLDTAWVYVGGGMPFLKNPGGETIAHLEEGARLDLEEPLLPVHRMEDTIWVGGLEGRYLRARVGGESGYIFSGGLVRLPHPAAELQDWGECLASSMEIGERSSRLEEEFIQGVTRIQEDDGSSVFERIELSEMDFQQGLLYALAMQRHDKGSLLGDALGLLLDQGIPTSGLTVSREIDGVLLKAELEEDYPGRFSRLHVSTSAACESWMTVELSEGSRVAITGETGC